MTFILPSWCVFRPPARRATPYLHPLGVLSYPVQREKPLFWLGDAHDSLCSDVREEFLFITGRDGPTTTVLLGDVYRVLCGGCHSAMYVGFQFDVSSLLIATTDTLRSTGVQKLGWMAMYVIRTISLSRRRRVT